MTIDLNGVFAVPPLARRNNSARSIDFVENERIVRHISKGGISRLIYGGNAFLYHIALAEFEALLEWLSGLSDEHWVIPSVGPAYGRALDQAAIVRKHRFTTVMVLPCADPRDANGLQRGYREIAAAAGARLIVYIKDETNFGADKEAGLDAVARLVDDGVCIGIKYAVVREDLRTTLIWKHYSRVSIGATLSVALANGQRWSTCATGNCMDLRLAQAASLRD